MSYVIKVSTPEQNFKIRVRPPISLQDFKQLILKSIGGQVKAITSLSYIDEDNDSVSIESQDQLDLAFLDFENVKRFKIAVKCMTHEHQIDHVMSQYREYLVDRSSYHFGYPYNLHYDHKKILDIMQYSINNLGDPFIESNYGVHSRKFELDVLAFFARMWKIEEGDYWGYITSCGTEGNLHSILCARELHPQAVLYGSSDSHYSVFKAARYYRMEYEVVRSTEQGEMDYEHLEELLLKNGPTKGAIIVANIGTTVKGAVDSVESIVGKLSKTGYKDEDFYIHCDGALYALMLPFMKNCEQVDFTKKIDSMCVSGHKFLGCPMPCGVTLCRKKNVDGVSQRIEYLNSVDTTIMGSRNGHAPIFLWYSLQKGGEECLRVKVQICHQNAKLLYNVLLGKGVKAMLNPYSTTVVFERPPEDFVKHWQLACVGDIAHVVVMPNVTVDKIMKFVDQLMEAREGTWVPHAELTLGTASSEGKKICTHFGSADFSDDIFEGVSFKSISSKQQKMFDLNNNFNAKIKAEAPPSTADYEG